MRTLAVALFFTFALLNPVAPASADPQPFNVSAFCTANDNFPGAFGSHGECVNAFHKDDATFFAIACRDPINQEFTNTTSVGQCAKVFRELYGTK